MSYFLFKQRDKGRETPVARPAHPAVVDAYEKGFIDGASETIDQLRKRFDLSQTPEIEAFLTDVDEKMRS